MMKKIWKKYGMMIAAAVFLTVAGLYFGFTGQKDDMVQLGSHGHPIGRGVEQSGLEGAVLEEAALKSHTEPHTEPQIPSQKIYVHICGEVMNPGVYELPEGSRIFEAVKAAGGFTECAAEESQNLAQQISDGAQIVILSQDEADAKIRIEQEQASGIVNINTASKEQLMTLTGIGESRAEDILRYREESGGFQSIEEIMNVPGIKESVYLKIKYSITV